MLRTLAPLLLGVVVATIGADAPSADETSPVRHSWKSVVTEQPLDMTFLLSTSTNDAPWPMVIYLKQLATPRVGTESDETIIADLRASGHLVAILDYANHPKARVPFINRDLASLRNDIRSNTFPGGYSIDQAHVFIVPEGSRLKRDVVFCREDERTFAMDIIYPSKPAKPVGAVLEFSCDNKDRFGNVSLSICSDTILDAGATAGFAVAMADHPVPPPYKGLDPMPECANRIKAAVRTLRAEGGTLGINGKIVPVGFSRGSGMALMLVITEGMPEFEGRGGNIGVSSAVQGAVIMSGRFTYLDLLPDDKMLPRYAKAWGERETSLDSWRRHSALDYLTNSTMPLFLTINISEGPDALHQMTVLRKRLAEFGNDEIFMLDREPRGHKVTLDPDILEAINQYLKKQLN